jgi:hypothetical protein
MKPTLKDIIRGGIFLTGGLAISQNINAQANESEYLNNTIGGVQYSDKTWKKNNFKLEEQVLFGKKNKNDIPVILVNNDDENDGELNFILYSENETDILDVYGQGRTLSGKKYIPTRLYNKKDTSLIKLFELNDINANLKKDMKKNSKKSENSYGFSMDITEEIINSKLPQITLPNGDKYVCFDVNWGNFYSEDGKEVSVNTKGTLPKVLVPLVEGKYIEGINLGNGRIRVFSRLGFYIPTEQEMQINVKSNTQSQKQNTQTSAKSNLKEKTNYMKYREEQEKQDSSSQNPTKNVSNTPIQTPIKSEIKQPVDTPIYHIIQKGDTFYNLADKYWQNTKEEDEIERLNPGVNPDSLKIGQKIRVK